MSRELKQTELLGASDNGRGHKDIVKLLLNHPRSQTTIDMNAKGSFGFTALMTACSIGSKDIVKSLLDHPNGQKIDINAKANNGITALMRACYSGQKDVVKILLDHPNFDINAKAGLWFRNQTTLMIACQQRWKDIVQLILDHPRSQNIEINAKDEHGFTGRMLANFEGHTAVVKLLQDHLGKAKNFLPNENEEKKTKAELRTNIFQNVDNS